MTPAHRGRAASGQSKLQLIQPCCSFHLLPILVHRNRHPCRGHNCRQNLRFDAWWSRAHKNLDVEGQHESGKERTVPPLDAAVPQNEVYHRRCWLVLGARSCDFKARPISVEHHADQINLPVAGAFKVRTHEISPKVRAVDTTHGQGREQRQGFS